MSSDSDLLSGLVRGDPGAFARLYDLHGEALLRYLGRVVGDGSEAEDLLQELFLRVYRGAAGCDPGRPLAAWLFGIAHHLAVDRIRRRERERAVAGRVGVAIPSGPPRVDDDSDSRGRLREAMDALPERSRALLALRYDGGMSFAEIASALRVPESTARWIHAESLRALGRALGKSDITR